MMIQIEPQSDIPIYTQLSNQIVEGIAKGDLNPGDSLPSVRSLAADLGVNMHTVNKSYHELEKKGIIQIVPKSGALIQSPKTINAGEVLYEQLKEQLRPKITELLVLGLEQGQIHTLIDSIVMDLKGSNNK
ncbi:MAG: GntR family transcriptional regulator [Heyndrickxia sp.]